MFFPLVKFPGEVSANSLPSFRVAQEPEPRSILFHLAVQTGLHCTAHSSSSDANDMHTGQVWRGKRQVSVFQQGILFLSTAKRSEFRVCGFNDPPFHSNHTPTFVSTLPDTFLTHAEVALAFPALSPNAACCLDEAARQPLRRLYSTFLSSSAPPCSFCQSPLPLPLSRCSVWCSGANSPRSRLREALH